MVRTEDPTIKIGDALQQQAAQMVRHIQQRQTEVDHRESELNARIAKMESDNRTIRLQLMSQKAELEEKYKQYAAQNAILEERLSRLAEAEKSYQQRRQEIDQAQYQLDVRARVVEKLERKISGDQKRYVMEHQLKMKEADALKEQLQVEKTEFEQHIKTQLSQMKEYIQRQRDKAKNILEKVDEEICQKTSELAAQEQTLADQKAELMRQKEEFEMERLEYRKSFKASKQALEEAFHQKTEEYIAEMNAKYEASLNEVMQLQQNAQKAVHDVKVMVEEELQSAHKESEDIKKEAQKQAKTFLDEVHQRAECILQKAEVQAQEYILEVKNWVMETSGRASEQSHKMIQEAQAEANEILVLAHQKTKEMVSKREDSGTAFSSDVSESSVFPTGDFGRKMSGGWKEKERNIQSLLDELQQRQNNLRKRELALMDVRNQMEAVAHELMDEYKRSRE
ncbi:MAG: hypothetical protein Q4C96_06260 [Planctomycetia bacterium]|nr:hypothetical protein [Planctomycetia bacterium]